MSDIDWTMTAVAIGAPILYVVIASFVWALVPQRWRDDDGGSIAFCVAMVWPWIAALLIAAVPIRIVAQIGPRTVAWYRRPRLPMAQVRR